MKTSVVGTAAVAVTLFLGSGVTQAQTTRPGTAFVVDGIHQEDLLAMGQSAYTRYCSGCHGVEGNGQGPAARWLYPKPRDFTTGTYKFSTTPSDVPPTDADLYRTITEGVYGTSMPNWRLVPEIERKAMVQYIKTFAKEWDADSIEPLDLPPAPANLSGAEDIKMGRTIYRATGCQKCHGLSGAGDGPSSGSMKDSWGQPIAVANFQRGVLRGGRTAEDIYRSIATGIGGTPMPSFGDSLPKEKLWSLVGYVRYLIKRKGDPDPDNVHDTCVVWNTCQPQEDDADTGKENDSE